MQTGSKLMPLSEIELMPLQYAVITRLEKNGFAYIFDEVGSGKTIQTGLAIWNIIKDNPRAKILIVCPKSITYNWYSELLQKFGFDFKIVEGIKGSLFSCDPRIANLLITGSDASTKEYRPNEGLNRLALKNEVPEQSSGSWWDLIVIDEAHEFKGTSSSRFQTIRKNYSAKKVLFLSATPIKNAIEELETELDLVATLLTKEKEKGRVLPTLDNSKEYLGMKLLSLDPQNPFSRNFKEIIRLCKENVKGNQIDSDALYFKNRVIHRLTYNINPENWKAITEHLKGYYGFGYYQAIGNIHQLVFRNSLNIDPKLNECLKYLKDKVKSKEKAVIFCTRKATVEYICSALRKEFGKDEVLGMTGDTHEIGERKQILSRIGTMKTSFGEYENVRFLVIIDKLATVGLNLPTFNHIVNYELPFTPADIEQRFGRIDRITGQYHDDLHLVYFCEEKPDNVEYAALDSAFINLCVTKLIWNILDSIPSKNTIIDIISKDINVVAWRFTFIKTLLDIEKKYKVDWNISLEMMYAFIEELLGVNGTYATLQCQLFYHEIIKTRDSDSQVTFAEMMSHMQNQYLKSLSVVLGNDHLCQRFLNSEMTISEFVEAVGDQRKIKTDNAIFYKDEQGKIAPIALTDLAKKIVLNPNDEMKKLYTEIKQIQDDLGSFQEECKKICKDDNVDFKKLDELLINIEENSIFVSATLINIYKYLRKNGCISMNLSDFITGWNERRNK
ncbi:superfamily II DNA or RNA helicase [Fontibacillus solani]|uniref:Superfamily II DNA or RNA helicase n=1 Tax=Fontibacillus solani TaxID=1572857 RepID=A0A7W3SW21_9BACL|nr:DEAD/DEAH box helicase [Fontibacillus solani]MBA9087277.1 superfamily II DNA or RNA helicase [Fontibacillus solani]